ncbi:AAA family ATPase [Thermosynechococcaceae cyanobacterium BACA0444]|uniref:AAA family ATPase n=1 Tax=Pseudocalidococcus azoricus BACA0444 TaxID=2918990 RepID=A0AAE4FSP9_9CYAN|nr:AAA family ATPase [Pseudocalidococcus azoricus]MDS3861485.1 AAA family ATPase [Pseudocalidococcus azoricus BACA0444]
MTEKLIIKNFAGIEELEIEVKKINILIGSETSGKSICAKLLFYFKSFFSQMSLIIEGGNTKEDLDTDYSRKFTEYFPRNSWSKNDFYIKYEIANEFISINRNENQNAGVSLDYSPYFSNFFDKSSEDLEIMTSRKFLINKEYENYDKISKLYVISKQFKGEFFHNLSNHFKKDIKFDQLYILSGRSFFSIFNRNLYLFYSQKINVDPFLLSFGLSYEDIKDLRESFHNRIYKSIEKQKSQSEIKKLAEDSLRAKYIRQDGQDFLLHSDGRKVSITNASSGQQELLPLTIILEALPHMAPSSLGYTVYVEEPEAHLFPSTQRNIIELMATVFNSCEDKLQLFITTHSPYVLTAINNLLQAGQIYETADESTQKKLEEILPKYKSLHTADVAAYSLSEGRCQNIINSETGLIDAQIIDSVSEDLAIQFDELLDLI